MSMAQESPAGSAPDLESMPHDVIIVGAGISGINSAYRIQEKLPSSRYLILEARNAVGGTWDLFRYPGVRSDSSMHTFGFSWRPWSALNALGSGEVIRSYLQDSASLHGIDKHIRFGHRLIAADWKSEYQSWRLQVEITQSDRSGDDLSVDSPPNSTQHVFYTRFLLLSTGYYSYTSPLATRIPGIESFRTVLHPQFWPSDYSPKGQRIAVIGSGATAVTLVPALVSAGAAHVTMIQRSPTYIVSRSDADSVVDLCRRLFPVWIAQRLIRFKSLLLGLWTIKYCAWYPAKARKMIADATAKQLQGSGVEVDPHFKPKYDPWKQRICVCPEGDFFKGFRDNNTSIVTGEIDTVTTEGIQMKGTDDFVQADTIVTATGLKLETGGGAVLRVDGQEIKIGEKLLWRASMLQDVPNCSMVIGYANNSWTLGADVTAVLLCRVLKHMKANGINVATPRVSEAEANSLTPRSCLELTSTYVVKGDAQLPRVADKAPWRPRQSYFWDLWDATFGSLTNGLVMEPARSWT